MGGRRHREAQGPAVAPLEMGRCSSSKVKVPRWLRPLSGIRVSFGQFRIRLFNLMRVVTDTAHAVTHTSYGDCYGF